MPYAYDEQNIFAKILRGEIPSSTVFESEHALAFRDITPQAPEHILVIPRGPYVNFDHFAAAATDGEIVDYTRTIGKVCELTGLAAEAGGRGYRVISNTGEVGVQEVQHLHVHVLGGRVLGRMLARFD